MRKADIYLNSKSGLQSKQTTIFLLVLLATGTSTDDSVLEREILSVQDCNFCNRIWEKLVVGVIPQ